ncbi:MAG: hypothetical protein QM296_01625 [Bacillota bacterium]|nr:hypothetical protein [Bacillota bacterium]
MHETAPQTSAIYRDVARREHWRHGPGHSGIPAIVLSIILTVILILSLIAAGQISILRRALDPDRIEAIVADLNPDRFTVVTAEGEELNLYELVHRNMPLQVQQEAGLTEAQMPHVFAQARTVETVAAMAGDVIAFMRDGSGQSVLPASAFQRIFDDLTIAIETVTATQLSPEARGQMQEWFHEQQLQDVDLVYIIRDVPGLGALRSFLSPEALMALILVTIVCLIWINLLHRGYVARWVFYPGVGAIIAALFSLLFSLLLRPLLNSAVAGDAGDPAVQILLAAFENGVQRWQSVYALTLAAAGLALLLAGVFLRVRLERNRPR